MTAEQIAADPVAAAAADRRNLISTAVNAVGAALSAWSVGVSEAGSLLGIECFVGPPLPPNMESCCSSLLLHLSPAAIAAALPPRLLEYLQREWILTQLAKLPGVDHAKPASQLRTLASQLTLKQLSAGMRLVCMCTCMCMCMCTCMCMCMYVHRMCTPHGHCMCIPR